MAYWIVRQEPSPIDDARLVASAQEVTSDVTSEVGRLYRTPRIPCGRDPAGKDYLWARPLHSNADGEEDGGDDGGGGEGGLACGTGERDRLDGGLTGLVRAAAARVERI